MSEKGSTSHGQVARVLLRVVKLLHHRLTVPQQLIQTELPVEQYRQNQVEKHPEQKHSRVQRKIVPFIKCRVEYFNGKMFANFNLNEIQNSRKLIF